MDCITEVMVIGTGQAAETTVFYVAEDVFVYV